MLGRWQQARIVAPEPAIAVSRDRAIRGITQAARHQRDHVGHPPAATQADEHATDRIGIGRARR